MSISQVVKVRDGGYSVASEIGNTGKTVKTQKGGYSVAQEQGTTIKTSSPGLSVSSGPKSVAEQDRIIAKQKEQEEINRRVAESKAQAKIDYDKKQAELKAQADEIKKNQAIIDAKVAASVNKPQYPNIVVGSNIKSTAQTQPVKQVTVAPKVTQPTIAPTKTPTVQTPVRQGVASAGANQPKITADTLKGSYYQVSKNEVPSVVKPSYAPTYIQKQQERKIQNTQMYNDINKYNIKQSQVTEKKQSTLDKINTKLSNTFEPIYSGIENNKYISAYDTGFKKTIGKAVYPGSALSFVNTPKQAANTVVGVGEGFVSFIPSTITLGKGLVTEPVKTIKDTAKGTVELAKKNPGRFTGNIVGSTIAGGAISKASGVSVNPSAIKEKIPYRIVKNTEPSSFILRVPEVNAVEAPKPIPSPAPRLTTPEPIEIKAFSGKVKQGKADAYFKITESDAKLVMQKANVGIENIRSDYGSFVELTPVSVKEPVVRINKGAKKITTTERTLIGKNEVIPNKKILQSPFRIEKYKKLEPAYFQDIKIPDRLQIPDFTYDMEIRPTTESTALVRTDKFTYGTSKPTIKTPPKEIVGYDIKQLKDTNPKRVPSKADYDSFVDRLGRPTPIKSQPITEVKIKNDFIKENVVKDLEYNPIPEPVMQLEKSTVPKAPTKFKDNIQINVGMDNVFEPQPQLMPSIPTKKQLFKYREPIRDKGFDAEFKRLYEKIPPKSVTGMGTFGSAQAKPFNFNINVNNPFRTPKTPPTPASGGGGGGSFGPGGKKTSMNNVNNPFATNYPQYPWKSITPSPIRPNQPQPVPIYGNTPRPSPGPSYGNIPQLEPSGSTGGSPRPADNLPGYNPIPIIYPPPEIPPTPQPYPFGISKLPPIPPKTGLDYPAFNPFMFSYPMPERKKKMTTEYTKPRKIKPFQWFIKNPIGDVIDYQKLKRLQNDKGPW